MKTADGRDRRVLAAILICACIVFSVGLRQQRADHEQLPALSATMTLQPMTLQSGESGLEWKPATDDGGQPDYDIPADLTPFFFEPVKINSSSESLLMTLPGIGPGIAGRIIHWRKTNGPFRNGEDLMRVPGIGPKRWDALKENISFE